MVSPVWFWAALSAYGVASALYLTYLVSPRERLARLASIALMVAFALHTCEIGARGVAGLHPASSAREAVGFVAWLFVGSYLLARIKWKLQATGAFVAPAAMVLEMTARLAPEAEQATTHGLGLLGRVHIMTILGGVAIFAFAAAVAVVYLIQDHQLKKKTFGAMYKSRGAALETLDHLVHRCVQIGFPIFTVGVVTGALWSARLSEGIRPEYTIAMVAWTAFAGVLVARMTAGWRGRRAAVLTIVGFTATLIVLGFYVVRGMVGG